MLVPSGRGRGRQAGKARMIPDNRSDTASTDARRLSGADTVAGGLQAAWVRTTAIAVGIAVAVVPFVAQLAFVVRATPAQLHATSPDDAYYYFEIARRAAGGEGLTFDGINTTSGFHPLWQWMLTGLHLVVPGDAAYLRAVHLLALVLVAGAFALTTRVIWRAAGPGPAVVGLMLASRSATTLWDLTDGMETALVVFCLAVLLTVLQRFFGAPDRRWAFWCGVASAALVLARLDMVIAVPIVGIAVMVSSRQLRLGGAWLAGGLAIGVPYAAWHLLRTGQILTTSAAVKQRWTDELVTGQLGGWFSGRHLTELSGIVSDLLGMIRRQLTTSPFASWLGVLTAIALAVLVVVGVLGSAREHRRDGDDIGPAGKAGLVLGAILTAKFVLDLIVAPIWVLQWYSTPARTAAAFAVGAAAATGAATLVRDARARWALVVVSVAALALVPVGVRDTLDGTYGYPWQSEMDRAVDWVVAEGPDVTYGSYDAGLAGYRLDGIHPLINLDGLVNDPEFVEFAADHPGRLPSAGREGVSILIQPLPVSEREGELACATTLWEGNPGYRTSPLPDGSDDGGNRVYVLDIRPCL